MEIALAGKSMIRQFIASYPKHMLQLLGLKSTAIRSMFDRGLTLPYCSINVMVLGLIYGLAAIYFSQPLLKGSSSAGAGYNALLILMVGATVAFLMHAGAALFLWVFCRGIGGSPLFGPVYMGLGATAIAFWPVAPGLAALQAGCLGPVLAVFTLVAAVNAAAVVYAALRTVTGLSHLKMTIAAVVSLIYIACFMYLWT